MISKSDRIKVDRLIEAIGVPKDSREMEMFLRDLLTEKELVEFANRWKAARMLWSKDSYVDIAAETGLSSTTIARVSKWLGGKNGGYRLILDRLNSGKKHHGLSSDGKGLC